MQPLERTIHHDAAPMECGVRRDAEAKPAMVIVAQRTSIHSMASRFRVGVVFPVLLAAWFLLAALSASGLHAQTGSAPLPGVAKIFEVLRPEKPRTIAWKKRQLREFSVAALHSVYDGSLPPVLDQEDPEDELTAPEKELVLDALGRRPSSELNAYLGSIALGDVTIGGRSKAFQLLALVGKPSATELVLQIALEIKGPAMRHPTVGKAYRAALARVLGKNDEGLAIVRQGFLKLDEATAKCTIDAMSEVGTPNALKLLAGWIGTEYDQEILIAIAKFPRMSALGCDSFFFDRLRSGLASSVAKVRTAAIRALARHRDLTSLEEIATRLEDDDRRVQRTALQALRQLTGMRLPADRSAWTLALRQREEWIESNQRRFHPRAMPEARAALIALIRDLSQRSQFSERLTPFFDACLQHGDPGVRAGMLLVAERQPVVGWIGPLMRFARDADPALAFRARKVVAKLSDGLLSDDVSTWNESLDELGLNLDR